MYTLVLEASTGAGSVALLRDDLVVHSRDVTMGASRDDALFPAVIDVLASEGIEASAIADVVCGEGPGSFTSLRIAGAVAKGIAHANRASLFAVPSLLLAAAAHGVFGLYFVHADALRGERYAMPVRIDAEGRVFADGPVTRLNGADIASAAGRRTRLSVMNDVDTASDLIVRPHAALISRVASWRAHGAVDLASWEPAYGRLAEAQVKWEATHAQTLDAAMARARET